MCNFCIMILKEGSILSYCPIFLFAGLNVDTIVAVSIVIWHYMTKVIVRRLAQQWYRKNWGLWWLCSCHTSSVKTKLLSYVNHYHTKSLHSNSWTKIPVKTLGIRQLSSPLCPRGPESSLTWIIVQTDFEKEGIHGRQEQDARPNRPIRLERSLSLWPEI